MGVSAPIVSLRKAAQRAAATDLPVLITGRKSEHHGKEIFAQAIHNASSRRLYPFIRINCAAIPKDLLRFRSLFGWEIASLQGQMRAENRKIKGSAHHGSIFLDEIGDLPIETQPKLLRVLEDKEFERIGGTYYTSSNFRLIAASNQDLKEMVAAGRFRTDLFYRLNVLQLPIPLSGDRGTISTSSWPISSQRCVTNSSLAPVSVDPEAAEALINYDWPGNVRELYNVLSRVLSFLEGDIMAASKTSRCTYRTGSARLSTSPVTFIARCPAQARPSEKLPRTQKGKASSEHWRPGGTTRPGQQRP